MGVRGTRGKPQAEDREESEPKVGGEERMPQPRERLTRGAGYYGQEVPQSEVTSPTHWESQAVSQQNGSAPQTHAWMAPSEQPAP